MTALPDRFSPIPRHLDRHQTANPEHVGRLIAAWRKGDQQAATRLFDRYADRVERIVKNHLNSRFRGRVGVDDLRQIVFCDVFCRLRKDPIHFDNDRCFRNWISGIARNRTIKQIDFESAAKRTVCREVRSNGSTTLESIVDSRVSARPIAPDEALAQRQVIEKAVSEFDAISRSVIELISAGYSQQEVAERLNVTDRTVRRKLQIIRRVIDSRINVRSHREAGLM
jgi:RNA polymerase sigma-70 factor (ECF subfamily)